MRDGNCTASGMAPFRYFVVSLPMRDGNCSRPTEQGLPIKVVSLPMRDGNNNSSLKEWEFKRLLAYL